MKAKSIRRFTRDEKASFRHALDHLGANKIDEANGYTGWYYGNKNQFIKRHIKTKALLRSLVETASVEPS
jgi:hypothetical protein